MISLLALILHREVCFLEYDDPHTLVVLVEEEIVFIDLHSENWPVFRAPYLATVHSSAITCSAHVANVQKTMWTKLFEAGNQQMGLTYSSEVIIIFRLQFGF